MKAMFISTSFSSIPVQGLKLVPQKANFLCSLFYLQRGTCTQYFSPSKTLIGILVDRDGDAAARNSFSAENLPPDGSGWIELLVGEMIDASHMDDARSRTSRVLELLEKSIKARIGAEAAYTFQEVFHALYYLSHAWKVKGVLTYSHCIMNSCFIQHI